MKLPSKAPKMFGATLVSGSVGIELPPVYDDKPNFTVASLVGRGRFSNVFRKFDHVYIYSFFDDFSKSIMAHAYSEMRGRSKHLVKIERLGRMTVGKHRVNVYKAPYYRQTELPLTQYNTSLLWCLQQAHKQASDKYYGNIIKTRNADKFNRYFISRVNPDTWPSMHAALTALADCANDWGDHYIFDNFRRENVAVDDRGNIKLIDPMFDLEKIQADFDARNKVSRP